MFESCLSISIQRICTSSVVNAPSLLSSSLLSNLFRYFVWRRWIDSASWIATCDACVHGRKWNAVFRRTGKSNQFHFASQTSKTKRKKRANEHQHILSRFELQWNSTESHWMWRREWETVNSFRSLDCVSFVIKLCKDRNQWIEQ